MNFTSRLIVTASLTLFALSFARADTLPPLLCHTEESEIIEIGFEMPNAPAGSKLEITRQAQDIAATWTAGTWPDARQGQETASAVLVGAPNEEAHTVFAFERTDTQESFVLVLPKLKPDGLHHALSGQGQLLSLKTGKASEIYCMDAAAARIN